MDNEKLEYCETVVVCPFCDELIVKAYDHSMLPDDLNDEELDEILCHLRDFTSGECEHLAFRSDWAYAGSEIIKKWKDEMERLAKELDKKAHARRAAETIAEAMILDSVDLAPLGNNVLSGYEFAVSKEFVEKFDGPRSGGPTYMHIFLKKR